MPRRYRLSESPRHFLAGANSIHPPCASQYEYKSELPKGHKKDLSGEMPAAYQPGYVEAAWQDWWYVRTYVRTYVRGTCTAGWRGGP